MIKLAFDVKRQFLPVIPKDSRFDGAQTQIEGWGETEGLQAEDLSILSYVVSGFDLQNNPAYLCDPEGFSNRLSRLVSKGLLEVPVSFDSVQSYLGDIQCDTENNGELTFWQKSFLEAVCAEQTRLKLPLSWVHRGSTVFGMLALVNSQKSNEALVGFRWCAVASGCVVLFRDWVGLALSPVENFGRRAERILSSTQHRYSDTDLGAASGALSLCRKIMQPKLSSLQIDPYQVQVLEPFLHWENRPFIDLWSS